MFKTGLNMSDFKRHVPLIVDETLKYFQRWGDQGEHNLFEAMAELIVLTASRCLQGNEIREALNEEVPSPGFFLLKISSPIRSFGFHLFCGDWLIDWLIDWCVGRLIDWLICGLIDWCVGGLIDWLVCRWIDWLIDLFQVAQLYADLDGGFSHEAWLLPSWIPLPSFRRRDAAQKRMKEIFFKAIQKRRASTVHDDDILQTLIETTYKDGRNLTDDEISGMLIGLLMAGQHTSSTTGSWLGFFLAKDQALQVRQKFLLFP